MECPTVLCVDDDAGIRELYAALLGRYGFDVITVVNGHHAIHVFQSKANDIDAVILDYEMPGMNGLELAILLKRHNPALPILMVSGSDPELEEMCPFVDAAIAKGVPMGVIVNRLELLLAERQERPTGTLPC